jgi:hypothetical protein
MFCVQCGRILCELEIVRYKYIGDCLRFETPPTWRARYPYLYPPGTGWHSYSPRHWVQVKVKVTLRLTVGQSWGSWPDIYYCLTVTVLFLWGALSNERTSLSSVYAAGPRQRSLSRVRAPWISRPYFTVPVLRLPFSTPPTTRRVTVESHFMRNIWNSANRKQFGKNHVCVSGPWENLLELCEVFTSASSHKMRPRCTWKVVQDGWEIAEQWVGKNLGIMRPRHISRPASRWFLAETRKTTRS